MLIESVFILAFTGILKEVKNFRRDDTDQKIRDAVSGPFAPSIKEQPLTEEEKSDNYWRNINNGMRKSF